MILILFSIKKHNNSNSSSNNNTIYSVCLVMDPHEVSREKDTPAAPLMTRVSISLLQIIFYIKDSMPSSICITMHRFK
jgi:hypothetical protein